MNACLACLGLGGQSQGDPENHETSRLLYDDHYRNQYGSSGQNAQKVIQQQPDPETLRREREEMEGICHRMSDQVIDVFAIAPHEGNRASSQDQAKALLMRNGINPTNLSESKLATFAQQSLAGQQKSIRVYRQSLAQKPQGDDSNVRSSNVMTDVRPDANAEAPKTYKMPKPDEMAYKTVKKRREEPISIELDQSESEAAKAAMG